MALFLKHLNAYFLLLFFIIISNAWTGSVNATEAPGFFRANMDELPKLFKEHATPLDAFTPEWLTLAVEHRTRYEVYDNGFTKNIPGFNDQIHQRTRFLFGIRNILDPLQFTLELTDMRATMAKHGQDHSNIFANHFDFTRMHVDLVSKDFMGTGLPAKFMVGRMVFDFGEGRLVAGHRWGTLTPTFDGMQFILGSEDKGWGLRVFGTRPVNRKVSKLDWNTPETYFSGAQISNRDLPWANTEVYWFDLREGNKGRQRNIATTGFRLFALPTRGKLDYEIESTYQFGRVDTTHYFAHRHHGEIGYNFNTQIPLRLLYLFDYVSGNKDPIKNFDFLFAKRRVEFGPTGILGIFFPSNLFSPAGFRTELSPVPTVKLMITHRAFWLANKRGPFVGSGLQDPTGNSGSFLGNMFDIGLRWDPQYSYLKRVSFDFGYTHFFKGSYFKHVPDSPGTEDTNYGYTMATFSF